tara:strand:- start:4037 stop:5524 length:1488 start_codon:yes stop_codon:yes gene_type:complete
MSDTNYADVIIVGTGNAGFAAAVSASENGAKVLMLEKASEDYMGGNSALTIHMRFAYNSFSDLLPLVKDDKQTYNKLYNKKLQELSEVVTEYTESDYLKDIMNVTSGKSDKILSKELVTNSLPTIKWMNKLGHLWSPTFDNPTSANVVSFNGKGYGLMQRWKNIALNKGVNIKYNHQVIDLIKNNEDIISGVVAKTNNENKIYYANSVILACGSFESNAQMRAKYLGEQWRNVKLRGIPNNTGEGLEMAISHGAIPYDDWSTCHASPQDINRPDYDLPGENKSGDYWSRYAYPFSIMVNINGNRFIDEGETWRGLTYAKTGKAILEQKNNMAFQLFDSKHVKAGVLKKYKNPTKYQAGTLIDLANKIKITDKENFINNINTFNKAVQSGNYNPHKLDGKKVKNIFPSRSNWALPLDNPPYLAYPVICGMTFCYGGLKTSINGELINKNGDIINGLYAVGEMLGGLWHNNYPSGGGMMAGAVFGKNAGKHASNKAI